MKFRYQYPIYWEANSGGSGSSSTAVEQALAAAQKELERQKKEYEKLQEKVTSGKLVDPETFLKTKIDAGELYPKDRFVGLQQTLTKEQEAKQKLESDLASITTTAETLKTQFETLDTTSKTQEQELKELRERTARSKVIFERFPELAPWEAKNLLPTAAPGELEAVFGKFAESLGAIAVDATKRNQEGGTTRTPAAKDEVEEKVPTNAKEFLAAANAALEKGDRAGYDKNYDQYIANLNKDEAQK